MLVLFETPAGYAIFKLLDENKLAESENLYRDFESPEAAGKIVKLKHFEKFADTTEALAATTAAVEGKLCKSLKKTLKKHCAEVQEQLAVADAKLGNAIKDKLSLSCVSNTNVQELMRCIRSQTDALLAGFPKKEMTAMALGLAHSLSRYKLKFSPDKIDTMIIQAVCLLDDLDKELNNYTMRCREWYGWHFPELGKLVTDNGAFVKTVRIIGTRENTGGCDLSDTLPEDVEERVKEAAEISMGTEISEDDIANIQHLCDQVIEISQYRAQLYDYLKTRMMAMAPNLTVLVGELVGARLISHAGSLVNLAKHPASTVQILGAEKALFRALKTKRDTPKYGLIYHAQLVGQASTRNKGKMSRMLAAKASLATRVDALGEDVTFDLGAEHRAKLEARLRYLEDGNVRRISGTAKARAKFEKYHGSSEFVEYPAAADSTLPSGGPPLKRPAPPSDSSTSLSPKKKKKKTGGNADDESSILNLESPTILKQDADDDEDHPGLRQDEESTTRIQRFKETDESPGNTDKKKKKKKTPKEEPVEQDTLPADESFEELEKRTKKKKKKKRTEADGVAATEAEAEAAAATTTTTTLAEKKKKKKKSISHD